MRSPTPDYVPKDVHDLLKDCALLRKLGSADQDALVARARLRKFDAGETIFSIGSHPGPGGSRTNDFARSRNDAAA